MSKHHAEELQSLLRGEIAAAETYNQVIDSGHPATGELREVQRDHGEAIRFLTEQLREQGVEAPTDSGLWGHFARLVEGGAKMLGGKMALTALLQGERSGLNAYVSALHDGALSSTCRAHIQRELLPAQQRHIRTLDTLIVRA